MTTRMAFHPVEGAVLDLESLQSIADGLGDSMRALLTIHAGGAEGLILEGLEPEAGARVGDGPPGRWRPDHGVRELTVSPGTAIVPGSSGRLYLVRVTEPLRLPWGQPQDVDGPPAVVLVAEERPAPTHHTLHLARQQVDVSIRYTESANWAHRSAVPVAMSLGKGGQWTTDLRRLLPPTHPTVRTLIRTIEKREGEIWKSEISGNLFQDVVLGKNWVAYQAAASAALIAANAALSARPTTTQERVNIVSSLLYGLRFVPRVREELLGWLGPANERGAYAGVEVRP